MKEQYFIGCDDGLFEGDIMAITVMKITPGKPVEFLEMKKFKDRKEFEKEKKRLAKKYNIKQEEL